MTAESGRHCCCTRTKQTTKEASKMVNEDRESHPSDPTHNVGGWGLFCWVQGGLSG